MSLFAPAYYPTFHCIAGVCQHSCCIGWEIVIDPATLTRYKTLPPKARKAIFAQTVTQKGTTSFRMAAGGRCPFLNPNGLCELILTHGESILCDICREHPRFYNVYSRRTEVGVGLCCEEAARLILTHPDPFRLVCIEETPVSLSVEDPFEADFFQKREEIFAILCHTDRPLSERIAKLLSANSISKEAIYANDAHWQGIYRRLERLDPAWEFALSAWEQASASLPLPESAEEERLIAYFLYRHLADAREDGRYRERIAFALLSAHVIASVANTTQQSDLPTLIDTARAYSAEVEYDEDNVAALLDLLEGM